MKIVNYGDNLEKRITLRLSENQMNFLLDMSFATNLSPSEFIRLMLNKYMIECEYVDMVGMEYENVETDFNY